MKTAQKIVNNLTNENIFHWTLRQDGWYLRITKLMSKHNDTYKIAQYTSFILTCYTPAHMLNVHEINVAIQHTVRF